MGGKAMGGKRMKLDEAEKIAEVFCAFFPGEAHVCGSIRRKKPEVGDIDIVIVPKPGREANVVTTLIGMFGHLKSSKKKPKRSGLFLGAQVDVLIAKPETLGTHLMHWTGSQQENIRMRAAAMSQGLKLSQLGLFRGSLNIAAGESEVGIYRLLGVEYRAPEDR